jgi:hypothetical protein
VTACLQSSRIRFALIATIVLITIVSIETWGYYDGLNVLVPVAVLCLVGSLIWQSGFLGWLTIGAFVAYVTLSLVTIAQ